MRGGGRGLRRFITSVLAGVGNVCYVLAWLVDPDKDKWWPRL